jgi:hypothetical protein
LGILGDEEDINRAWENIRENIKLSAKESLELHELKRHKHCFDEELSSSLTQQSLMYPGLLEEVCPFVSVKGGFPPALDH